MLKNILTQLKQKNKTTWFFKLTCMCNLKENKSIGRIIKYMWIDFNYMWIDFNLQNFKFHKIS